MLRGHVFAEQIFGNDAFALFIDTFLDKQCGIVYGCGLTNTSNTITISDGYFCIRGRFLQVVGSNTIEVGTDNAFCKLVCEIDLNKENTDTNFEQATFKVIKGTNDYPVLTQQDITDAGYIYQFEFAKFKTSASGIIEFNDTRAFLNFSNIYSQINTKVDGLIQTLKTKLANVEDGSAYMLSSRIVIGSEIPTQLEEGQIYFQYFD